MKYKNFIKKLTSSTIIGMLTLSTISIPNSIATDLTMQDCPYNIEFVQMDAGNSLMSAIDRTGDLWTWGNGYLGNGQNTTQSVPLNISQTIQGNPKFSKVTTGRYNMAVIDTAGNLWTWGSNSKGQLGNGQTTDSSTPINITDQLENKTKFKEVSIESLHTVAIDLEGNLWGWGNNTYAQLSSQNGTNNITTPINISSQIEGNVKFLKVSASDYYTFAIDTDENLWKIGNGTNTPTKILENTKFSKISNTAGIDKEGNLWNLEYENQLFNDGTKFIDVGDYSHCSIAIDSNGELWGWGVIKALSVFSDTPQKINSSTKFEKVTTGNQFIAVIDENGKMWTCGSREDGQIGDGVVNYNDQSTFLKITNAERIVDSEKPEVTVAKKDYNTFDWTASDNVKVTGYQITTSNEVPSTAGDDWITTGTLTSGEKNIDTDSAKTYYVWAKDSAGNVSDPKSITAYTLTKMQGANTTLTIKENNSSGDVITDTQPVLDGTTIYIEAIADTGYTLSLKVSNTNFNSGTTKVISANTIVESSATQNTYTITLNNQSATSEGTTSLTERYGDGIYNGLNKMTTTTNPITIPSKEGYTFEGYYTETNGSGIQMITADGKLASSFTSSYYSNNATLYAKWTENVVEPTPQPEPEPDPEPEPTPQPEPEPDPEPEPETQNYTLSIKPGTDEYAQSSGTQRNVLAPAVLIIYDENYVGGTQNTTKAQFYRWTLTGGGSISSLDSNFTVYTYGNSDGVLTASYNAVNLPTPQRNGYTFDGWYKDSDCTETNEITGTTFVPTSNITLYAKWIESKTSNNDLYLLPTKKYKINEDSEENTYIYRVNPNMTIGKLKVTLETNGLVDVFNVLNDTEVLVKNNEKIGTGMFVRIRRNGKEIVYQVSVKGDIDGNGEITATDLAVMKQQILKEADDLNTVQYMALDISNDQEITATDLAAMKQVLLKELDLSTIE